MWKGAIFPYRSHPIHSTYVEEAFTKYNKECSDSDSW